MIRSEIDRGRIDFESFGGTGAALAGLIHIVGWESQLWIIAQMAIANIATMGRIRLEFLVGAYLA